MEQDSTNSHIKQVLRINIVPIITKIETQKNKSRVNIFVDDSFFCGLNKETAILFGLKENKEVNEEKLKSAIFESEVKSAFEKSLDYLGRRMYTKYELLDRLTKKGYEREVAEKAIEKLEDYHYVDDKLFAKQFAQSNQKVSKRILKGKLIQKGVSADIIPEIIETRTAEEEYNLCLEQARKYLKSKTVSELKDIQKMQASLARKGFDYDTIKKVCKETLKFEED
jgi:regulatory protein